MFPTKYCALAFIGMSLLVTVFPAHAVMQPPCPDDYGYHYSLALNPVNWGETPIPADPITFHIFKPLLDCSDCCPNSYAYAKDKNHAFYEGRIIPNADPSTFEPIAKGYGDLNNYAKDKKNVYWRGKPLTGADAASFVVDKRGLFAHDKAHAYYHDAAHPVETYKQNEFITVIGDSVFAGDKKIEGADAVSFEIMGKGYGRDKNAVYSNGRKLPQLDPTTFRFINDYFVADKSGVYSPMVGRHDYTISGLPAFDTEALTLVTPDPNHKVRTIDKTNDVDLYKFCALSGPHPTCCTCVRDDETLYAILAPEDKRAALSEPMSLFYNLEALPLEEIRIEDNLLKFRDRAYTYKMRKEQAK